MFLRALVSSYCVQRLKTNCVAEQLRKTKKQKRESEQKCLCEIYHTFSHQESVHYNTVIDKPYPKTSILYDVLYDLHLLVP